MHPKILLITLTATALPDLVTAKADTTTIGFFNADISITVPVYSGTAGSVAGIDATATTYHIGCRKNAPKSLCQIDRPWTMIQGEETFSLTGIYTAWSSGKNAVTAIRNYDCKFKHSTESASCAMTVQVTGTVEEDTWSSTASMNASVPSDQVTYYGLEVTGGLESFTKSQATQTPGVAAVVTAMPLAGAAAKNVPSS
ncbi:hypothetical protein BDV28DRAFT_147390 [Aspergillus coremiiformis]|uniref:AA1-like domain-containing protein n=1 Tax=Aspergillus coremiiformis TaxID=138285 RepID=A0A5N6Z908_9EURO|nr:hypothetical protein BDV28DRAFT_147390 [Aspergillus coremiiformis]